MKKLLLFEFHLLGDAVMSLPFLRAAQEKYDVFVCCSPVAAKAYELILPAERIFRLELPSWRPGGNSSAQRTAFAQTRARLRTLQAAIGVTVWADVRVHLLMHSLGLPERIGFPMNPGNYYAHHVGWRRRNLRIGQTLQTLATLIGRKPLTTSLQRRDYQQHHMQDWVQLGASLDLSLDVKTPWLGPPAMKLTLPEAAQSFFARNAGQKIWLLHPGAAQATKRWPHFQELVETFFSPAQVPLIILEDPAVAKIKPLHDNCLIWPMSSLADFVALCAGCDRILCNDSAAGHIGAALRKHVITIFGSGSAAWFAPETERTVFESFLCPYRPCMDKCFQPDYICLQDISLSSVKERLQGLL